MPKEKTSSAATEQPGKPGLFAMARLSEPAVTFLPSVRVELLSNRQAIVDGCRGIIEYSDTCIRLSAERLVLKFTGTDLEIRSLSDNSAVVEGFLVSVEFC